MIASSDTAGAHGERGEAARTPFEVLRDQLVDDVNAWLATLAGKKGETLDSGDELGDEPRISAQDYFGKQKLTPGASLTGDGETTPYRFESVRELEDGITEIVTVQGGDLQTDSVVSFMSRWVTGGKMTRLGYEVVKSGVVVRKETNSTTRLGDAAELQLAQEAFNQIKNKF